MRSPVKEKSDDELMEGIQMLMAQVGEAVCELSKRKIDQSIMVYNDGSTGVSFFKTEEVTPGKVRR